MQFKNKLTLDFGINDLYAESVIKSAAIADLYLEVKGKQECRMLGIDNKAQFLEIILYLSKKYKWVSFEKIKNKDSLVRKLRGYKQKQGVYEGLSFLISKKESNVVSKNAKKITDAQLAILTKLIAENESLSDSEVYEIMKLKFNDIIIKKSAIRYHIRKIELDSFKKKHIK